MRKTIIPLLILFFALTAFKQDKPAYRIFGPDGKKLKYKDLLEQASKADIILFGELHNNPICHWLQLELTRDLYAEAGSKLILGAEMFETDDQLILDEYLKGIIPSKNFENEAKLWPNYDTDYSPLVDFARDNELSFIATNIPRRYAAVVHRKGFEGLDSLSAEAQKLLPPLPVPYDPELKGYRSMMEMMGGMGGHANANLPKAQAIKDATMAYNIVINMGEGSIFVHYNGTYHSQNYEGIVWYLKQSNPELSILTIASAEQDSIEELQEENHELADFILCIPSGMTKTH
ncbi:MAG: ChaN family lipoprotein [Bacteroidetes bacterium]|nr:ChaN family lipoprotein [Bacteroidota bacterium]